MAENDDTAAGGQADATQPSQPPSEAPPPVT